MYLSLLSGDGFYARRSLNCRQIKQINRSMALREASSKVQWMNESTELWGELAVSVRSVKTLQICGNFPSISFLWVNWDVLKGRWCDPSSCDSWCHPLWHSLEVCIDARSWVICTFQTPLSKWSVSTACLAIKGEGGRRYFPGDTGTLKLHYPFFHCITTVLEF